MAYFNTRVNSFVKAFIISDALLYSSLNVVNILFTLYVTTKIPGGSITMATKALIAGFIVRIFVELLFGRTSSKLKEKQKVQLIIAGMAVISLSYIGFIGAHNVYGLALMWGLNGFGWAIAYPAKLALVAKYIRPEQASQEWGLTDALNMSLIVITMAIGSFVVTNFSYDSLFIFAATINACGILPYAFYLFFRERRPVVAKADYETTG